jgi:hypothetical protein
VFQPEVRFNVAIMHGVHAGFQIFAVLVGGAIIWWWMHRYHRDIIVQIRERYNMVVVRAAHYGLVLCIMIVNALIATSFVQIYYRIYFF